MSGILIERPKKSIKTHNPPTKVIKINKEHEKISKITIGYNIFDRSILGKLPDIMNNSIYISTETTYPELKLNTVDSIAVSIDMSAIGIYESLLSHVNSPEMKLRLIGKLIETPDGLTAIKIELNAITLAYYLPDKNTFIFGDITWHNQYIDIVLSDIWPKILQGVLQ